MAPQRPKVPRSIANGRRSSMRALSASAVLAVFYAAPAFVLGPLAQVARRRQLAVVTRASPLEGFLQLPDILNKAVDGAKQLFEQDAELSPMDISSLGMAEDGIPANGILETMTIRAMLGSEKKLASKVAKLLEVAQKHPLVLTAAASQNKDDPCDFMLLLRYESMENLRTHQASSKFKTALEAMEQDLEKPIGLYLVDEQHGELGMARHPFGPGGEGGRDDAIYSSRANKGGVGR